MSKQSNPSTHFMNYRQRQKMADLLSPTRRKRFTEEEDDLLKHVVNDLHIKNWEEIAQHMPGRTARQCRDRYNNYLFKNISSSNFSPEEDEIIIQKYQEFGPHWAAISRLLKGRSGNTVKNRWYKFLSKRVVPSHSKPFICNQNNNKDKTMNQNVQIAATFGNATMINPMSSQQFNYPNSFNLTGFNSLPNSSPIIPNQNQIGNINIFPQPNIAIQHIQSLPNWPMTGNEITAPQNPSQPILNNITMQIPMNLDKTQPTQSNQNETTMNSILDQPENRQITPPREAVKTNSISVKDSSKIDPNELFNEKTELMDFEWEHLISFNQTRL